MKKSISVLFLFSLIAFFSCGKVKQKVGETIDSGAQTVGKTATDVVTNIDKGISEGMAIDIQLSDGLKKSGLSYGKYYIRSNAEGKENTISMYLITNRDFDQELYLKLYDKAGVEMGRTVKKVTQKAGLAAYCDFVFDDKIQFESKSKLTIE